MSSLANKLAFLPKEEKAKLLAGLSPEAQAELNYNWNFWGRKDQLEPDGNWNTLLILAGRGYGKTRTGSEWIRKNVCGDTPLTGGKYRRIAVVAETAADARDVCVEGDSGLLAVHPSSYRPLFEPSKRRLTWPNGAVATLYNATEPDQLRGPQHDAAWCFPGYTPVLMADGSEKRIDQINAGELVMTRRGARKVLAAAMTNACAPTLKLLCSDGRTIEATQEHPIYINDKGWVPLSLVREGDDLCVINASNLTASAGIDTTADITNSGGRAQRNEKTETDCIALFTKSILVPFLMGITSIIRTKTFTTTIRQTLNCSNMVSILATIRPEKHGSVAKSFARLLANAFAPVPSSDGSASSAATYSSLKPGMLAFAQGGALKLGEVRASSLKCVTAPRAAASIWQRSEYSAFAARNATWRLIESLSNGRKSPATNVAKNSCRSETTPDFVLDTAPSLTTVAIKSVERSGIQAVYDLAIEGEREFFANGILVHNCDELCKFKYVSDTMNMLEFGLRLGAKPRKLITTTPRPIQILREIMDDPMTHVIRGSTLDNSDNLPPSFLKTVYDRYAGTRLGRQELEGEILDDVPGALWTRKTFDEHRVKKWADLPAMKRVIVSIDPAAKASADTDETAETGIIVAGLGADSRGYVLDDVSCREGPEGWARMAIAAYDRYEADAIVVETNQGGDMIKSVIRNVRPELKVIEVHASRGKTTRAEPISGLYAQGKVSHLGALPILEDQMILVTPFGPTGGGLMDRVDSLVWALTELMMKGQGVIRMPQQARRHMPSHVGRSRFTGY